MTALLRVENLRTWFDSDRGPIRAVDGVDFEIESGRTLGVVGESGSGKSVTALSVMRLVDEPGHIADESRIVFDGRDLTSLDEGEMEHVRGDEISMIFQEPMTSLNQVYTVGDQIAETVRLHQGASRREARKRVIEMLGLVKVADAQKRMASYPHELSGGQRQRVLIAMALACEPELLIADEPTTALDVTIQAQILELIAEIQERLGLAVLLITHDLGVVAGVCKRVAVMYGGKIMEQGSAEQIFHRPGHPYTRGLLRSTPRVDVVLPRLVGIDGMPPDLIAPPPGCPFQPRCDVASAQCAEMPALERDEEGREVACWHASDRDPLRAGDEHAPVV